MNHIFIFKVTIFQQLKVPQDLTYASMSSYLHKNSEMKFHGASDVMTNPVQSVWVAPRVVEISTTIIPNTTKNAAYQWINKAFWSNVRTHGEMDGLMDTLK